MSCEIKEFFRNLLFTARPIEKLILPLLRTSTSIVPCIFAFVTNHMTDVFLVGVGGAFLKLLPLAVLMFLLWAYIGPLSLVLTFCSIIVTVVLAIDPGTSTLTQVFQLCLKVGTLQNGIRALCCL